MSQVEPQLETSIEALTYEAIDEKYRPLVAALIKRRLNESPKRKDRFLTSIQAAVLHDVAKIPGPLKGFASADFTYSTPFQIDAFGKGEIIKIIIDNLPTIIEAILKIIAAFGAILLCLMLPTQCDAAPPNCVGRACQAARATVAAAAAVPARAVATVTQPIADRHHQHAVHNQPYAAPIRSAIGQSFTNTNHAASIAAQSATARAATMTQGHNLAIEMAASRRVGVGFSTSDPTPRTCYPLRRGDYVSVRGPNGWYATKVLRR